MNLFQSFRKTLALSSSGCSAFPQRLVANLLHKFTSLICAQACLFHSVQKLSAALLTLHRCSTNACPAHAGRQSKLARSITLTIQSSRIVEGEWVTPDPCARCTPCVLSSLSPHSADLHICRKYCKLSFYLFHLTELALPFSHTITSHTNESLLRFMFLVF